MMELSLYQIESGLADLIEMRETCVGSGDDPQTDYEHQIRVIDEAIRQYIETEIRKVDGIRSFWRHCELMRDAAKIEAEQQAKRSAQWAGRLERLKSMCKTVMESMPWPEGKPKKLEGRTGALYLKANGGKAVEITDRGLVPPEFQEVTVTFRADHFALLQEIMAGYVEGIKDPITCKVGATWPALALVAAELAKPCGACSGDGFVVFISDNGHGEVKDRQQCEVCGGSGRRGVPGARLAERGQHVEVR